MDLKALRSLSRDELKAKWQDIHKRPAPVRIGRELMVRAIAYELQVKKHGGLSAATKRKLRELAEAVEKNPKFLPPKERMPRPGTKLVREWGGETHTVTILEKRFEYRGKTYNSLSEVARIITGARWSGPRFFGLNGVRTTRIGDA
jgi:hypothetical protein